MGKHGTSFNHQECEVFENLDLDMYFIAPSFYAFPLCKLENVSCAYQCMFGARELVFHLSSVTSI